MKGILSIIFLAVSINYAMENQVNQKFYILDDFDYNTYSNQNDFFANRGIWESGDASIQHSFNLVSGENYALRLDYILSSSGSAGGWWEHFSYSHSAYDNPVRNISVFDEFHFSYRGGTNYPDKFIIEFIEKDFQNRVQIVVDNVTDQWQEKVVLLNTELGDLDLTQMMQFAIVLPYDSIEQVEGTLYFDQFCFIDNDGFYSSYEELLDIISEKSFKYFIENMHPETGLIRDKASNRDVSSTASVGFGLAALGIAIERGWISRLEGALRTKKALSTLLNTPQGPDATGCAGYHGFFYHMLNLNSGIRDGTSELSSIDSAILLAGVLFVREYFTASDTNEVAIRDYADDILNRVDWQWMYDTSQSQFYMEWKPETGFAGYWNYYTDETILICFLAMAFGEIEKNCFYSWNRTTGDYGDYSFYQAYWGSLFTYFFAQCWFDFKNLGEDELFVDWWENSKAAAEANRQFCIDHSGMYTGYGENSWGLTACLGPEGYNGGISKSYGSLPLADPPPNHDGTIPPYGAGSCIVFFSNNPGENLSIQALEYYYNQLPKLWGIYGFKDSFNMGENADSTDDWYADDYIGIDLGPMLVMIENYRSGLIWKTIAKNEKINLMLDRIFKNRINEIDQLINLSPSEYIFVKNYPNPFNPSTRICYQFAATGEVELIIYSITGEKVRTLVHSIQNPGNYEVLWDGKNDHGCRVSAGIYFYILRMNNLLKTGKMLFLK